MKKKDRKLSKNFEPGHFNLVRKGINANVSSKGNNRQQGSIQDSGPEEIFAGSPEIKQDHIDEDEESRSDAFGNFASKQARQTSQSFGIQRGGGIAKREFKVKEDRV